MLQQIICELIKIIQKLGRIFNCCHTNYLRLISTVNTLKYQPIHSKKRDISWRNKFSLNSFVEELKVILLAFNFFLRKEKYFLRKKIGSNVLLIEIETMKK